MVRLLLLAVTILSNSGPSLDISPRFTFEPHVKFQMTLPPEAEVICFGWVYPVVNLENEMWPYRRSCEQVDGRRTVWQEYSLPFPGEYQGFLEVYRAEEKVQILRQPFRILEKDR
jgi:hypothetical protein